MYFEVRIQEIKINDRTASEYKHTKIIVNTVLAFEDGFSKIF